MKRLLSLVSFPRMMVFALLFLWSGCFMGKCRAQVRNTIDPYRFGLPTPLSIAGIRFWWVAEDLANGKVTSNWIDRINGFGLGNSTGLAEPTNTASGVHFNGAQILTNQPTFFSATNGASNSKGAAFFVITPTTPAFSLGSIHTTSGGWGFYTTSGGIFREFGNCSSPTWGAYSSGTPCDIGIDLTDTQSCTNAFFLNGAVSSTGISSGIPAGSGFMASVGEELPAGANPFKGHIKEIIWFSRHLTVAEMATLHAYAAAKYGY